MTEMYKKIRDSKDGELAQWREMQDELVIELSKSLCDEAASFAKDAGVDLLTIRVSLEIVGLQVLQPPQEEANP